MVTLPIIQSTPTSNKFVQSILHGVGVEILLTSLEARRDAFFLDIENDVNPISAFAFRLSNGANDNLNLLRGIELSPTPSIDEIRARPIEHFGRLIIGTNVHTDAVIAEANDSEIPALRQSIENAKQNGAALAQSIASAVNADKVVRTAFDSYLSNARQATETAVREIGRNAENSSADIFKPFVSAITDFIAESLFANPRKSGDGKRVSKELHEYNYLNRPVLTYDGIPDELASIMGDLITGIPAGDVSHIQVMLFLMKLQFFKGDNDAFGLGIGSDAQGVVIQDILRNDLGIFDNDGFSYGNFVDAFHVRKLLAELKKLVQSVRAANVKEVLTIRGITQAEYLWEILLSLPPAFFRNAAADIVAIEVLNERQVRKFVAGSEIVAPVNNDGRIVTTIEGYAPFA